MSEICISTVFFVLLPLDPSKQPLMGTGNILFVTIDQPSIFKTILKEIMIWIRRVGYHTRGDV